MLRQRAVQDPCEGIAVALQFLACLNAIRKGLKCKAFGVWREHSKKQFRTRLIGMHVTTSRKCFGKVFFSIFTCSMIFPGMPSFGGPSISALIGLTNVSPEITALFILRCSTRR
jgi:hypothetical protein